VLNRLFGFAGVGCLWLWLAAPAAQSPITAGEAKSRIGQRVVVEDRLVQATYEPESGSTFLDFGRAFPNQILRVIVPAQVRAKLDAALMVPPVRLRIAGTPRQGASGTELVCSAPGDITRVLGQVPAKQTSKPTTSNCCRICTTGKACGNSCIARNLTCRQPPGCACNGL
jgi:hypothetical protein